MEEQKQTTSTRKTPHYLTAKESRRIAKENLRITKQFEKRKKRKNVPESEYLSHMRDENNVVEFDDLHTYFFTDTGVVKAVNGVSFDVPQGATVGIVGESGCGKSITSLSLMQLVAAPSGQIVSGEIRFKTKDYKLDAQGNRIPLYEQDEDGNVVMAPVLDAKGHPVTDRNGQPKLAPKAMLNEYGFPAYEMEDKTFNIAKMPTDQMRRIRGKEISMIFQEPMTSLNPVFTVGSQLREAIELHTSRKGKEAEARAIEMLTLVGVNEPEKRIKQYPYELSGGMRQRVMIAMALSCEPDILIADEPTTALDVTIQAQILELMQDLQKQLGMAIIMVTHDLGVIADMCDEIIVMYGGRVCERGTAEDIFYRPSHEYTKGLLRSIPNIGRMGEKLVPIPGTPINLLNMPKGCAFCPRCENAMKICLTEQPPEMQVQDGHRASCWLNVKAEMEKGEV